MPKSHSRKSKTPEALHVLLCVVGGTPAVVTETVYALMVERKIPLRRMRLITTQLGRQEIERQLFRLTGEESGGWHLLKQHHPETGKIAFDLASDIIVPRTADGKYLDDIRTTEENDLMVETLLAEAGFWCAQEHTVVHASVAGGRKTMSLFMGYALQLVGRPDDRLYHVLVPPEYDGLPGFFYPTPRKTLLPNRQGIPIDASRARLDLAEIPFVRFRALLQDVAIEKSSFRELVELAERKLLAACRPIGIRLSLKACTVQFLDLASGQCLGSEIHAVSSEAGFLLYYHLCRRALKGNPWTPFFHPEQGAAELRAIAQWASEHHPYSQALEQLERYAQEIEESYSGNLSALRKNWNRWIEDRAQTCGINDFHSFDIQNMRKEGHTLYGVILTPERICLE